MNTTTKLFSRVLAVLLLIACLTACSPGGNQDDGDGARKTVKFAYIGPMTGDYSQYGVFCTQAIKLRLQQLDYKVGNYDIQFDVYDDANDAKESVALMQNIIDDDALLAVMGPFASTNALAIAPTLNKEGIIHYAITSSHPDMTGVGEYVFRGALINTVEAQGCADYLIDQRGAKTVSVCYVNNDWGKTFCDAFVERFESKGGTVLVSLDIADGSTIDFSPICSRMMDGNPDALMPILFYNDTASVLLSLERLEYAGEIMLSGAAAVDDIKPIAGDTLEGTFMVTFFSLEDSSPMFAEYRAAYQEAYGSDVNLYSTMAYDAMCALAAALEAVGADRKAMRDYLNSGAELPGASGTWSFNETRDPLKRIYAHEYKDGEFRLV